MSGTPCRRGCSACRRRAVGPRSGRGPVGPGHRLARHQRAAVLHHAGGQPVALGGGRFGAATGQPHGEVGAGEGVAGRRRVDDTRHRHGRHGHRGLAGQPHQRRRRAALDHHLGAGQGQRALQGGLRIGQAPQRLLVVQRHQRHAGQRRELRERGLRGGGVGPQPWPVVVVEDHRRAACAQARGQRRQARAAGRRQDGQADAAEVERAQRVGPALQRRVAVGGVEVAARRGLLAPVMETAFTLGVDLDEVQPRQPPRQAAHEAGAQALGLPALQQPVAERVVAQRGGVVHAQALRGTAARQVDRRVQRVAAKGLLQRAEGPALQFEHALAEAHHRPACPRRCRLLPRHVLAPVQI